MDGALKCLAWPHDMAQNGSGIGTVAVTNLTSFVWVYEY